MQRLLNTDNQITRTTMANMVKGFVGKKANNLEFTVDTNKTIKTVLTLREKFKAFDALLDPIVTANKEKVGTILKGYLASGNKISFLEIDDASNKLVYVGPMMGISGLGYKKWGTISWCDRVFMLRTLVNNEDFVNYANILSR